MDDDGSLDDASSPRATMSEPAAAAARTLQELAAALDYPMFVVTTAAAGDRAGCLVGFATQCSIDPARLLVCLSKKNHTYRVAASARILVVHFLSGEDRGLASLFGERTGDDTDKFADCRWRTGPDGAPVLEDCWGWIAGRILDRLDAGDHVAFLLDPVDGARHRPAERNLGFQGVKDMAPGHEA